MTLDVLLEFSSSLYKSAPRLCPATESDLIGLAYSHARPTILASTANYHHHPSAFTYVPHNESELATLDAIGHDGVGASCDGFVNFLFFLDLDIQAKGRTINFS